MLMANEEGDAYNDPFSDTVPDMFRPLCYSLSHNDTRYPEWWLEPEKPGDVIDCHACQCMYDLIPVDCVHLLYQFETAIIEDARVLLKYYGKRLCTQSR